MRYHSSPTITKGYFGNPDATHASWDQSGFYHTGDVGYCDRETKKWYLIDRRKVRNSTVFYFPKFLLKRRLQTLQ